MSDRPKKWTIYIKHFLCASLLRTTTKPVLTFVTTEESGPRPKLSML